ncbi:16S rRNA (uracil(1498)-N(3))-methyltransferase [Variovorax sp. RHLX14]|uniref:16S rRNA (uracil(1498)-N(3))-methyltransferase n=1 Tax=Variovorax sp. RHLX14 TaxID=1259731 RepID=UPI003F458F21
MPRFFCAVALRSGDTLSLPPGAARHVQVLRMQPGEALTLFDGAGGEYAATVERMGRSDVAVVVGAHDPVEREAGAVVHLAAGMPANERMDWLVEKATELGVASIQPLMSAHGVLKLVGERAEKKRAHWEAIAVAACEQCGRNRVPMIHPVRAFADWIGAPDSGDIDPPQRLILSLAAGTQAIDRPIAGNDAPRAWRVLSGPEGGLSAGEEARALAEGFAPVTLGTRVLRAETAGLAALISLTSLTSPARASA